MVNVKRRKKARNVLTAAQSRLLKESLKQMLGPGLIQPQTYGEKREEHSSFLKDVLSPKILDSEWFS